MSLIALQAGMLGSGGGGGGGYLDSLSPASVSALGIRKLISTATNAIRVRRSSDNTEQDIGFTGNALDTTSLASFVGANNGFVVTIYDQTGNGLHATQATASKQPRIVNTGVYDGAIVYDGTDDCHKITSLTMGNAQAALFTKIKKTIAVGVEIMFELSDNYNSYAGTAFVVYGDAALYAGMSNTNNYTLSMTTAKKLFVQFDKAQATAVNEVKVWLDGVSQDPPGGTSHTNTTGTLTTRDFFIAARNDASLQSDQSIETLVLYNADATAIRASIEALL